MNITGIKNKDMYKCHTCKSFIPGIAYEDSPCSKCFWTQHDEQWDKFQFSTPLHTVHDDSPCLTYNPHKHSEYNTKEEDRIKLCRYIRYKLIKIKGDNLTYEIVKQILQGKFKSHAEAARYFKCKKQNIFYHIHKAARKIPALYKYLIIAETRKYQGQDKKYNMLSRIHASTEHINKIRIELCRYKAD